MYTLHITCTIDHYMLFHLTIKLSPMLLVDMAVLQLDEVGLEGFSDEDGSTSTGSDDVGSIIVPLGYSV